MNEDIVFLLSMAAIFAWRVSRIENVVPCAVLAKLEDRVEKILKISLDSFFESR